MSPGQEEDLDETFQTTGGRLKTTDLCTIGNFSYPNNCKKGSATGTCNTADSDLNIQIAFLDLLSTKSLVQEPMLISPLGLQFLPELILYVYNCQLFFHVSPRLNLNLWLRGVSISIIMSCFFLDSLDRSWTWFIHFLRLSRKPLPSSSCSAHHVRVVVEMWPGRRVLFGLSLFDISVLSFTEGSSSLTVHQIMAHVIHEQRGYD